MDGRLGLLRGRPALELRGPAAQVFVDRAALALSEEEDAALAGLGPATRCGGDDVRGFAHRLGLADGPVRRGVPSDASRGALGGDDDSGDGECGGGAAGKSDAPDSHDSRA